MEMEDDDLERESNKSEADTTEIWEMTTNADTSQASGLGERNSNIETEFSNFSMPMERRPLSFINSQRPSLNPVPVADDIP